MLYFEMVVGTGPFFAGVLKWFSWYLPSSFDEMVLRTLQISFAASKLLLFWLIEGRVFVLTFVLVDRCSKQSFRNK